jgi:hypothetical protein
VRIFSFSFCYAILDAKSTGDVADVATQGHFGNNGAISSLDPSYNLSAAEMAAAIAAKTIFQLQS